MRKIIYDFDGTLTPYSLPFYAFFKKCSRPIDVDDWVKMAQEESIKNNINLYESLYKVLIKSLKEAEMPFDNTTFLMGVENVEYNPGVLDFFQEKDDDIMHYILTSVYDEYVLNTSVAPYFTKVYGTSFKYKNGEAVGIKELMNDTKKPEKIDLIADGDYSNVIYIGDGLTDIYAFKHIIQKGGTAVLVHQPGDDSTYNKLINQGINVKYFVADYTKNSDLYNFLKGNN